MEKVDITKHLQSHLEDELKGAEGYLTMYDAAIKMENYEIAEGVLEMAQEEYTHAEFIRDIMFKKGIMLSEEHGMKFNEIEEMLEKKM